MSLPRHTCLAYYHPLITKKLRSVLSYAVILQAINSGYFIDSEAFRAYGLATARLYVEEYEWYPMPPSVHPVLIHGADIIIRAKVPIACLSEEPQESQKKYIRRFRERRARKYCRYVSDSSMRMDLCFEL